MQLPFNSGRRIFFTLHPSELLLPPLKRPRFPSHEVRCEDCSPPVQNNKIHNEGTQPIYTRGCREIMGNIPTPSYTAHRECPKKWSVDVAPSVPSCACETDVVLSWPEELPPSEPACCLATKAGDPSWEIPKNWQFMVI